MASKLISLSLYTAEIELLDDLVALAAKRSLRPKTVNRSTVIRDLIANAMREIRKENTQEVADE